MGVQGLWDLLAPVGRRVSVETLAGKKVAIDASIWMIQFMKAMRDEKGEMVRSAHLLGFFRRICKLLYLRTKPVFVFDGGTPALKRRTVIARRRQRENAQAKVRKTAEKLLLNHLKAMRLKELANDLVDQRKYEKINTDKGKKDQSDEAGIQSSNPEQDVNLVFSNHQEYEKLDEMLAASIAAEEGLGLVSNASNTAASVQAAVEVNMAKDEEMISETDKRNKISKGKEVLLDQADMERSNLETNDMRAESYYHGKLDEMLVASIAALEGGNLSKNGSTSGSVIHCEDDDQDEEEMILPRGQVDPSVLASLPPSMQLDLLVQMREKLMAENRQKYQEVKKVPEKFSELQIQAYLKTVAFRREIDQVQKSAAGKDLGGLNTSRIASEANREFIFSSTFTGDKELLASTGVKRNGDRHKKPQLENPAECIGSGPTNGSPGSVTGLVRDRSNDHVETYLDESGRVRVSRVRAMGMRMTRDLERNLELMKEIELGRSRGVNTENSQSAFSRIESDVAKNFPSENNCSRTSHGNSSDCANDNNMSRQFQLHSKEPIQVSFEIDPEKKCFDCDDDLFTNLVAGNPVPFSSPDNGASKRQCSGSSSASDDDWEDGIVERNVDDISPDLEVRTKTPLNESYISDDSEVEWEEGICDIHENSSSPSVVGKTASRGQIEEEAELQEAIRRSLEDQGNEKFNHALFEHERLKAFKENAFPDAGALNQELFNGPSMSEGDGIQQNKVFSETLEIEKLDTGHQNNISQAFASPGRQLKFSVGHYPSKVGPIGKNYLESISGKLRQGINEEGNLSRQLSLTQPAITLEAKDTHMNLEESSNSPVDGRLVVSSKMCSGDVTCDEIKQMETAPSELTCSIMDDSERQEMEAEPSNIATEEIGLPCDSIVKTNQFVPCIELSANYSVNGGDVLQKSGGGQTYDDYFNGDKFKREQSALMDDDNKQDLTEASLEKEIRITSQECINLGNEQRKLERNAESVSSEMFAECQELLQMFGLPYIIAPMEAEAQCAYMELANLVDGVVTDDSDVFLFGARNVYKNIFDDRKYVETYFMKDIEKELGLSREKLIRMALLLGSDYTEGISGIGIVNAIEVMNAFPEENGLHEFREWIESPDPNILGKLHVRTSLNERKKGSKVSDGDTSNPHDGVEGSSSSSQNNRQAHEENQAVHHQEIKRTFMDKHRNVSKNWHIPSSFPSEAVISAYTCPQVDKSTEPFRLGKPDLLVLHRLCWEKFGWDIKKSDELLLPVLKEYDKHETQLRLEAFYTFNERFAKIRSKRIKKAVKGITGKKSLDLMDDPVEKVSKNKQKRMRGSSVDDETEILSRADESTAANKNNSLENSNSNKSTKKRVAKKVVMLELESPEHQLREKSRQRSWKQSHGNGRGKRLVTGRGRRNRSSGFREDDSSTDDGNDREDELGVGDEKLGGLSEVRRSKRTRKPVNYTVDDVEIDDAKMSEQGDENECDKVVMDPCLTRTRESSGDAANVMEEETVERPSVVEEFSSYYIGKGGGFCNDEAEDGQIEVKQSNYFFEAEDSVDYLKMGGGFCVDDKEAGEDQNAGCISPAAAVQETAKPPCPSTVMEDSSHDIFSLNSVYSIRRTSEELPDVRKANALGTDIESKMGSADAKRAADQSSVDNSEAPSVDGLSGMPFLKRKRRRN